MNKYKLNNIIKKDLLKTFKNTEITKKKFSFALLNSLCKNYEITEYVIEHYCCYGEDENCWVDEEVGWLSCGKYKNDKEGLNRCVYRQIKKFLKNDIKDLSSRKIFIGENNYNIFYVIPLRDRLKQDITLVFAKDKNDPWKYSKVF